MCKCDGWLTALKNLHYDAISMSQHKLCDEIYDTISEFKDKIAEIEQGINGAMDLNDLKATDYNVTDLEKFIKDVLSDTESFYKNLDGDSNIGMRSYTEAFIGDMQQYVFLNSFCIKHGKEAMDESRLTAKMKKSINESIHSYFKTIIRG